MTDTLRSRAILSMLLLAAATAANAATTLGEIQQQWDTTNFAMQGDAQVKSFELGSENSPVDSYS